MLIKGETTIMLIDEAEAGCLPWSLPSTRGAEGVNSRDEDGSTHMAHATKNSRDEDGITDMAHATRNSRDEDGITDMAHAARNSRDEDGITEMAHATKNSRDEDGITDLILATKNNHGTNVQAVILKGTDVNLGDNDGKTALMHSISFNNVDIFSVLINNNANVNIRDKVGKTALMYAVRSGNTDILNILIYNKADINAQDNAGKTALMLSCEMGRVQFCELLIFHNCDMNLQDNEGQTALMHAVRSRAVGRRKQICRHLCTNGVDMNIQDKSQMTALMYAAKQYPEICKFLVKQGRARLNLKDKTGKTALMHAALLFHLEACEALLNNNADVSLKDNTDMPALTHVLSKLVNYETLYSDRAKDGLRIAELLVKHGADIAFNRELCSTLMERSGSKCGLTVGNLIRHGYTYLTRMLICNGIMDAEFDPPSSMQRPLPSVVECAATFGHVDLIVFILAKRYLTEGDLTYIRLVGSNRSRQHTGEVHSKFSSGKAVNLNNTPVVTRGRDEDERLKEEARVVIEEAASRVWLLKDLALITVTSSLGSGPNRWDRVDALPLPPKFKRTLMFQE